MDPPMVSPVMGENEKGGSHMAMWDDADTYANGIIKFLLGN